MKKYFSLLFLVSFFITTAQTNPFIRLDEQLLAQTKKTVKNGTANEKTIATYKKLIRNADKLLAIENPTVMDKTINPPTENKHDYLSISRYWWPNPNIEGGLPWIRKDGKTNPDTQTNAVDRQRLGQMTKGVWTLSLAYYFTDKEKYAKKAVSMIDTWFINEETKMNPHLDFAQSVPGNPKKRPSGILDGRSITLNIPDAINLIYSSKYWNKTSQTKINKWLSDYLIWLTESELGKKGAKQQNNHGSWYKFQVAALALYTNNKPLVIKTIEEAEESLDLQLNNKGGQEHELARTRSFFYSCFNLQALMYVAAIGEKAGVDMWNYSSKNKKSLQLAVNYLTPVINGEQWNHKSIKGVDLSYLVPILIKMSKKTDSKYKELASKALNIIEEKGKNNTKNTALMETRLFNYSNF